MRHFLRTVARLTSIIRIMKGTEYREIFERNLSSYARDTRIFLHEIHRNVIILEKWTGRGSVVSRINLSLSIPYICEARRGIECTGIHMQMKVDRSNIYKRNDKSPKSIDRLGYLDGWPIVNTVKKLTDTARPLEYPLRALFIFEIALLLSDISRWEIKALSWIFFASLYA